MPQLNRADHAPLRSGRHNGSTASEARGGCHACATRAPSRNPGTRLMSSSDIWDVLVVGAGPAGSSAALAALREQPDARVLLLDRSDFPRDKSCGDGVAPHVLDVLRSLGADDAVQAMEHGHPAIETLELSLGAQGVIRRMRRPALVIPRTQ